MHALMPPSGIMASPASSASPASWNPWVDARRKAAHVKKEFDSKLKEAIEGKGAVEEREARKAAMQGQKVLDSEMHQVVEVKEFDSKAEEAVEDKEAVEEREARKAAMKQAVEFKDFDSKEKEAVEVKDAVEEMEARKAAMKAKEAVEDKEVVEEREAARRRCRVRRGSTLI